MAKSRIDKKRQREAEITPDVPSEDQSQLLLSMIPAEIIVSEIAPRLTSLNLQTAGRLSSTCTALNNLFYPSLTQQLAKVLLNNVIHADWAKISKFTAHHPEAAFIKTDGIDINGSKIYLSPIEYAFFVHDKYAQRIFEDCAVRLNRLSEYREAERMLTQFYDFQPFYQAYQRFIDQTTRMLNHQISFQQLCTCWYEEVGGAQKSLAPRWLIKFMLAIQQPGKRYQWSPQALFNDQNPPTQCYVTQARYFPTREIDIFNTGDPQLTLGVNFAITRFVYEKAAIRSKESDIPAANTVIYDLAAAKRAVAMSVRDQVVRMSLINKQLKCKYTLITRK